MSNKKITDLASKSTAAAADIVPIVDPADNTTKRTTVGGLASAVGSSLPNNSVAAPALATSAIFLGYSQITTTTAFVTSSTAVAVSGLSVTVTVPAGGRRVKVTFQCRNLQNTSAGYVNVSLWDGTVGSGTQIAAAQAFSTGSNQGQYGCCIAIVTPSAGTKTYSVGLQTTAGSATIEAATTFPAFILVEAI